MLDHHDALCKQIRQFYLQLKAEWQLFDADCITRAQSIGLYLFCAAGVVEQGFCGKAWTAESTLRFEVLVQGQWKTLDDETPLPNAIRDVVPAWERQKVVVQPDTQVRARLTRAGEENRESIEADTSAFFLVPWLGSRRIKPIINVRILELPHAAQHQVQEDRVIDRLDQVLKFLGNIDQNVSTAAAALPPPPKVQTRRKPKRAIRAADIETLVKFLKELRSPSQCGSNSPVPLTQAWLAQATGLSRSTVSRCLKDKDAELLRLMWQELTGKPARGESKSVIRPEDIEESRD